MSVLRSDINTDHLVLEALYRGLVALVLFVLAGFVVGLLAGWVTSDYHDHVLQGLVIGSGFGGIAGVLAALLGVPSNDDSASM